MNFDFVDNKIIISDYILLSHQISQLKFWGFKNINTKTLVFSGQESEKILIKTVTYLQKEEIIFSTTENCENILALISERNRGFQKIKELGESFKNGAFDDRKFKEFTLFLPAPYIIDVQIQPFPCFYPFDQAFQD